MIEVKRVHSLSLGVTYALLAALVFSGIGVTVKISTTAEMPVTMIAFFRQVFSAVAIAPFILMQTGRHGKALYMTERFGGHVARALFSLSAMYFLFLTISLLPLADAILLSYTRPLFIPLIVWIWQRKRIESAVWVGLLLGFVGVALILKPEGAFFDWGVVTGLCSALCGAMAFLMIRRLGKTEPPLRILSYYFCFSIVISAVPLSWSWKTPSRELWVALAVIGALGAVYQICITLAYRYTRATLVGGVLFSAVIFTLIWDWLVWNHFPDWISLAGIVLVCCGSIVAIGFARVKPAPGEQSTEAAAQPGESEKG